MLPEKTDNTKSEPHLSPAPIDFVDLRRLTPLTRSFGYDRGQPIDRYYIEKFLGRQARDIAGHVVEIGDDRYTRQFGGSKVTVQMCLTMIIRILLRQLSLILPTQLMCRLILLTAVLLYKRFNLFTISGSYPNAPSPS
jgi:hypothetical protein